MPYTPSSAAQAIATQAGTNQAALAAPLTALQTSVAGGNLAPAAFVDAIVAGVGYAGQASLSLSANNYSTNAFADVPGAGFTFSPTIAKTFVVHCDFGLFATVAAVVIVRLVVAGANGPSQQISLPVGDARGIHLAFAAAFSSGSNVIKVQWTVASGTANVDANSFCNFVVQG